MAAIPGCRWAYAIQRRIRICATTCSSSRSPSPPRMAISLSPTPNLSAFYMVSCIYLAASAGQLRLASTDPHVQPQLDYNYLAETFDRQRLREAVRIIIDLLEHRAFKEIVDVRIGPTDVELASDAALDEWMARVISTSHHVSSTCKMGPATDSLAVVDQYGRVYGLENLRVVDAAIMPDCVRANTNATTMVIGERVADFILQGQ